MNKLKTVLLTVLCTAVIVIVSCRAMLEEIVPIRINKRAVEYANVDPNSFGVITSLADAKRVRIEIIANHRDKQLALKRWSEDDNLAHGDAYGFINNDIDRGEYALDLAIGSKDNPFSIFGILAMLGVSGGSLAIGKKYFKSDAELLREHDEKVKNGNA